MTLLIISFISGVLTVLAPCILPLLPIIIGGSVTDTHSKLKPYIITASLAVSVIVFTLVLKASTIFIDIPQSTWSYISGGILIILGLIIAIPEIWEKLPGLARMNSSSQQFLNQGMQKQSYWGDIMMGAALGPVFSSCSPTYFVILASILPASFALGMVYLLAYTAGLSLILLLIALIGQKFVHKLEWAANPKGWFKRGLGILFLLVGLSVAFGADKKFEAWLLDIGIFDITAVEQKLLDKIDDEEQ